jgi:hypothetical protein
MRTQHALDQRDEASTRAERPNGRLGQRRASQATGGFRPAIEGQKTIPPVELPSAHRSRPADAGEPNPLCRPGACGDPVRAMTERLPLVRVACLARQRGKRGITMGLVAAVRKSRALMAGVLGAYIATASTSSWRCSMASLASMAVIYSPSWLKSNQGEKSTSPRGSGSSASRIAWAVASARLPPALGGGGGRTHVC